MGGVIQDVGQDARGTLARSATGQYLPALSHTLGQPHFRIRVGLILLRDVFLIRLRTLLINGYGRLSFYEM